MSGADPQEDGAVLGARPRQHLAVVTCMDARIDVFSVLDLKNGDAHIIRNAGGLITEDVLRSLTLSQRRLGTTKVTVIQHTKCGLLNLDEDVLHQEIRQDTGREAPFSFGGFRDIGDSVRGAMTQVRSALYLPERDQVRGYVFDVDTRLLCEVESDVPPVAGIMELRGVQRARIPHCTPEQETTTAVPAQR